MKLKKWNEYVKEDLNQIDDSINKEDIMDVEDPEKIDNTIEDGVDDSEFKGMDNLEEEDPEEGHEYEGTVLLKKLASELGTTVVDNSIEYKGHKINYYSETEAFHIDNKTKLDTIEDVIQHFNN